MKPSKVPLCLLPTPIHRLDGLSEELGLELWIKRDDLTGFALGGNKGRKLEYMIADALAKNAEVVVTCGAVQSNFVRQLAAACSRYGIVCAAAVMDLPFEDAPPEGPRLNPEIGNPQLDRLLGADLRHFPDGPWELLYEHAEAIAKEYESKRKRVYRVPIGGSSPLGAYAFYEAGCELQAQTDPFDWIVAASSSGSTQTGLAYAFRGTETKVLGVCSDPEPEIVEDFAELGEGLAKILDRPPLEAADFRLTTEFVGPGYGVPSEAGNAAIARLAQTDGVFLDPIYSGKAFAALVVLAERGDLTGRVLFWHTGGLPTLFAT